MMTEDNTNSVQARPKTFRTKKAELIKYLKTKDSVLWLSWADLRHEWILTLCLIAAITAVLSPLSILFGLKYGLINIYVTSLIQDPLKREIRPLSSQTYEKAWFEEIGQREDVAFIIPNTRQLSATIVANIKDKETKEELELIPTAEGDPLLLENGAVIPKAGECVITQLAAEGLEASIGETLVTKASRLVGGKYEYGSLELKIVGILPIRASVRKLLYVQLDILEGVESFKDGRAVPEFDWPGELPTAYPQYNGVIVITPQKLDEITKYSLAVGTGFTKIDELDNATLLDKAGFTVSPDMGIYFAYTAKKPVGEQSIKNVQKKLRGKNVTLFPYIKPIESQILDESGKELATLKLYALSLSPEKAIELGVTVTPDWGEAQNSTGEMQKLFIPGVSQAQAPQHRYLLKISKEDDSLRFPVTANAEPSSEKSVAFIPAKLAGMLKLYEARNISYDEENQEFILSRRGYASFRMYAGSIYAVEGLRKFFEGQSLNVHSAAREIEEVVQRAKYVDITFWLIAIVGVSGTIAALIASLYASVERKKRELGVLRLIGLSGASLFRFPIYQGMLIGIGGFLSSAIVFKLFSMLINKLFTSHVEKLLGFSLSLLKTKQNLCWIPFSYLMIALSGTIIVAGCAAMIAALRVNQIEPAEALRDE